LTPRAFTPLDGIVIVGLLALCYGLWVGGGLSGEAGGAGVEVITVAGNTRHPLLPGRELRVAGPLGESVLRLDADGVRFVSSPCPLQLCVRSGTLSRSGAVAACLPNRVAVQVVGEPGTRPESVDAIGR
jgi:hypothetical protein